MSRAQSHVNTALAIIEKYKGEMPMAAWLRQYFSANKKHGSRDRKEIAHLCYAFFRLGTSFKDRTWEEKMHIAVLLCRPAPPHLLAALAPKLSEMENLTLPEQVDSLGEPGALLSIFPFNDFLSPEIDVVAFNVSFLFQPDLFLRLRPHRGNVVRQQLDDAGIRYQSEGENALRLPNQSNLDAFIQIDRDAVIQDISSQHVLDVLLEERVEHVEKLWDCCAASGGKTLLAMDELRIDDITVTDIRESILHNLKSRLERAGIRNFRSFTTDLSTGVLPGSEKFHLIICDAPCSGSGTWSRTPEQLRFFKKEQIDAYATLQKKIAVNATSSLAPGGYFLYITCSVFKKENEEVVAGLLASTNLKFKTSAYLKGYDRRADTLFVALFVL